MNIAEEMAHLKGIPYVEPIQAVHGEPTFTAPEVAHLERQAVQSAESRIMQNLAAVIAGEVAKATMPLDDDDQRPIAAHGTD